MKTAVDLSALPQIDQPGRVAIIKSKWYAEQVGSMERKCIELLEACGVRDIVSHVLPGSLEFPLAAADLLETDSSIEAIVCLGIILKGDTLHFELISEECMRGLGWVMRQYRVPVVVEVLPVFELQQALDRAGDDEFNKGIEAAVAALEMMAWRRSIGASRSAPGRG